MLYPAWLLLLLLVLGTTVPRFLRIPRAPDAPYTPPIKILKPPPQVSRVRHPDISLPPRSTKVNAKEYSILHVNQPIILNKNSTKTKPKLPGRKSAFVSMYQTNLSSQDIEQVGDKPKRANGLLVQSQTEQVTQEFDYKQLTDWAATSNHPPPQNKLTWTELVRSVCADKADRQQSIEKAGFQIIQKCKKMKNSMSFLGILRIQENSKDANSLIGLMMDRDKLFSGLQSRVTVAVVHRFGDVITPITKSLNPDGAYSFQTDEISIFRSATGLAFALFTITTKPKDPKSLLLTPRLVIETTYGQNWTDPGHTRMVGVPHAYDYANEGAYLNFGPKGVSVFEWKRETFMVFHQIGSKQHPEPFLYKFKGSRLIKTKLYSKHVSSGGKFVPMDDPQYHFWTPLIIESSPLPYFVASVDPLVVVKCNPETGGCEDIWSPYGAEITKYNPFSVMGGTPWLLYKWPYYISITQHSCNKGTDTMGHSLAVMAVKPFRLVYISAPLGVPDMTKCKAGGLVLKDPDTLEYGVACHKEPAPAVIHISGIKAILKDVISQDLRPWLEGTQRKTEKEPFNWVQSFYDTLRSRCLSP